MPTAMDLLDGDSAAESAGDDELSLTPEQKKRRLIGLGIGLSISLWRDRRDENGKNGGMVVRGPWGE